MDTLYLTNRESEILLLISAGLSAKEAASTLHIALSTIERHIENVQLKTRTRNRAHMVAVVIQDGWLKPIAYVADVY